MMHDRRDARDVWNRRGLLRRRRHLRNNRRALLEGDERPAGDRFACAFLRRARDQRKKQRGEERMHDQRCEVAPRESLAPSWVTRIAFEHAR